MIHLQTHLYPLLFDIFNAPLNSSSFTYKSSIFGYTSNSILYSLIFFFTHNHKTYLTTYNILLAQKGNLIRKNIF